MFSHINAKIVESSSVSVVVYCLKHLGLKKEDSRSLMNAYVGGVAIYGIGTSVSSEDSSLLLKNARRSSLTWFL
jgi:hypothetical protein